MASLNWLGTASGTSTQGPIVGANPHPNKSIITAGASASSYLSTGSLSVGDTGEIGGLTDATIEFWFGVEITLPSAERTLVIGPETAAGTRQWGFDLTATGTIKFYVRNAASNTAVLVTSTTAIVPTPATASSNTWYYIAGAADSTGALVRL